MSKSKPHDAEGFSLLEVIVALSIMAIGFATVMQLFSGSIKSIDLSDEYLKAVALANHKMDELELDDFLTDEFSGEFENEPNYSWTLDLEPYENEALNDEEENIQLAKVTLNVLWNSRGKERNVEIVTVRTDGFSYTPEDALIGANASLADLLKQSGNITTASSPPASEDSGPPAVEKTVNFCGRETTFVNVSGLGSGISSNISGN